MAVASGLSIVDPYEERPVTDDHPELVASMRIQLRDWWRQCKVDREYDKDLRSFVAFLRLIGCCF